MPIDITHPTGLGFGPGVTVHLHAEVSGPFPTGTHFTAAFSPTASLTNVFLRYDIPTTSQDAQFMILGDEGLTTQITPLLAPAADTNIELQAEFIEGQTGAILDQGAAIQIWNPTDALGWQTQQKQAQGGQGLTPEESQQLLETWQSTFPAVNIDTTVNVGTGLHPPGAVVGGQLPVPIFGIIVRITQVPEDIAFITADANYSVAGLAVVSIFRADDLWMRVPIHTSSKVVSLFSDVITAAVTTLTAATLWLERMSYQVAFREGVAGEVIEMRFP